MAWEQLVDLIDRNGNAAPMSEIVSLLNLDEVNKTQRRWRPEVI